MAFGLDPYIAWEMEKYLQSLWRPYLPQIKFGGYCECFEYIDPDVFKEKIIDRIGNGFKSIGGIDISWR